MNGKHILLEWSCLKILQKLIACDNNLECAALGCTYMHFFHNRDALLTKHNTK
jgi:hypothetical protein